MTSYPNTEHFMEHTRERSPEINRLNSKKITPIATIMGNYMDIVTIGGGKCHSVTRVLGSKWWEIKA